MHTSPFCETLGPRLLYASITAYDADMQIGSESYANSSMTSAWTASSAAEDSPIYVKDIFDFYPAAESFEINLTNLPAHTKVRINVFGEFNRINSPTKLTVTSGSFSQTSSGLGNSENWNSWFDDSASVFKFSLSMPKGRSDDTYTLEGISVQVYDPRETEWTDVDPKEVLEKKQLIELTETGTDSISYGSYASQWKWKKEYYIEQYWEEAGDDQSGSWGSIASVDKNITYSNSKAFGETINLPLPLGFSGSVSGEVTKSTSIGGNYKLVKNDENEEGKENKQYDIRLFLKKQKIFSVYTTFDRIVSDSSGTTEYPEFVSEAPKILEDGYVEANSDWWVRIKTRDPLP